MQFQVRTDNHIKNSEALAGRIQAEVEGALYPASQTNFGGSRSTWRT